MKKNIVPMVILVVVILGLIGGGIFYLQKKKNASKQADATNKALDYINKNLLQSGVTASLKDVAKENGLFKITITLSQNGQNQEGAIYETLDGKLLFIYPPVDMSPKAAPQQPKSDKPDVRLFVMAFCPYGNQAEDLIKPVLDLLKDKISLTLNYIVSKDSSGKYTSLHGDQELNQDVRELCVAKYQNDKFWDFVLKINEKCTAQNADTCWEQQATDLGIDAQKIKDCQKNEAAAILDAEAVLNSQYNASSSPTLIINGVLYSGDRTSDGYKNGICSAFNTPPQECQQTLSSDTGSVEGGCGSQ